MTLRLEVDGTCGPVPNGTACDDGSFCNGDETCTEGVCAEPDGDPCAGHVGDGDDDCAEACDEDSDACAAAEPDGTACGEGRSCLGGACVDPLGAVCSANAQCASGNCTDGLCCETEHCGAYRCGSSGVCLDSCSSAADCAAGHECSAAGRCQLPVAAVAESGCDCAIVGAGSQRSAPGWLLVPLTVALRRRRR